MFSGKKRNSVVQQLKIDSANDLAAVFATPKKRLVATRPGSVQ